MMADDEARDEEAVSPDAVEDVLDEWKDDDEEDSLASEVTEEDSY